MQFVHASTLSTHAPTGYRERAILASQKLNSAWTINNIVVSQCFVGPENAFLIRCRDYTTNQDDATRFPVGYLNSFSSDASWPFSTQPYLKEEYHTNTSKEFEPMQEKDFAMAQG